MASPVRLAWKLHSSAPIEAVWALLSDTDRFNRVAGVGLHFESEGGTHIGWVKKFGMKMDWEEMPFQFERPLWFVSERRFRGGPASTLKARLRLAPDADGTVIRYSLEITPRSALFWPVLAADARLNVGPPLAAALDKAIAWLENPKGLYDPPPPELTLATSAKLREACGHIKPGVLGESIENLIAHAPLYRQNRIRPLSLAQSLNLPDDQVIAGCLQAVRAGALSLTWELLCPSCQAPKNQLQQLDPNASSVHCPTCDIRYDGTFPDAVAVSFRTAPGIRDFEVPVECLLSPARTPHVLASEVVPLGETVSWKVALKPGGYRLETHTGHAASLEVREGVRSHAVTVDVRESGLTPVLLRVAPGDVQLHLRNIGDDPVRVQLEERWRPPHTLTAGRLLEVDGARELLPADALVPGLEVAVTRLAAIGVDVVQPDEEAEIKVRNVLEARDAHAVVAADGAVLATFTSFAAALEAAEVLDTDVRLATGLAVGLVVEVGPDKVPSGSVANAALDGARSAGAARTVLPPAFHDDEEVVKVRAEWGDRVTVREDGLVQFAASEKARDERVVQVRESEEETPEKAGRYRLGDVVGVGGMGKVWAATDPEGRSLVVKMLLPEIALDPEHTQRFYNEARLSSGFAHPHIVRVFDWGHTADGHLFLAMERLTGCELADLVGADVIDGVTAARIGMAVLDALEEAHRAGVVHRDMKPSNVFMVGGDAEGGVKVIDFGIAAEIDAERLEEKGMAIGTPIYMAPEQLTEDPLDGRTDVYAVGLLIYKCLTGDLPFRGKNPVGVAFSRLAKPPIPLEEATEQPLPEGLASVVMKALALDAEERWQSAAEMRDALAGVVEAHMEEAPTAP